MKSKEKIINKILDEIKSYPIIDFIASPITEEVRIDNHIYYVQH